MSNRNQYLVNVTVAGRNLGPFLATGDIEATGDGDKIPQPGGGFIRYPGRRTYGEVTLMRVYEVPRDSGIWTWLESQANVGSVSATERVTDPNGSVLPDGGLTITGMLTGVSKEGSDTRESGARMMTLTLDRLS